MKILNRFKSPVVWAVALTSIYTYIETSDFSTIKGIVLAILGIMIAIFGAVNNPTDRDHV